MEPSRGDPERAENAYPPYLPIGSRAWLWRGAVKALRLLQVNEYTFIFVVAALVGIFTGLIGGGVRYWFASSFEWVWHHGYPALLRHFPMVPPWVWAVAIPTTGGLLLGPLVARYPAATKGHHGIPRVMEKIARGGGVIPPSTIVLRTLATTLTIPPGSSAGREAPVVQVGAAVGSLFGQWLKLPPERVKVLLGCGASGGVAAAFDTPLAGVMFTVELLLGELTVTGMGPLIISAVLAVTVARMAYPGIEALKAPQYQIHSLQEVFLYFLVGIMCGVFAWIFVKTLEAAEDFFDHSPIPVVFRTAIGGLGAGLVGFFFPPVRGSQFGPISEAMQSHVFILLAAVLFLAKFIATVSTLGSGCSGGALTPSLFMGSMLGASLGWAFKIIWPQALAGPGVYALVGMVAFTGAMMHAPITMVIMALELSKSYQAVIPMMIAVMTATLVARTLSKTSLYTGVLQREGINFILGRDENILREIRVSQVMQRRVVTLQHNLPFKDIVETVLRQPGLYFPVVDSGNRFVGVISLDDLKTYITDEELAGVVVAQDMTNEDVLVLAPNETLYNALRKMNITEMDELPVVSDGRLVGMVSRRDIMRAYEKAVLERQLLEETRP